MYDLANFGYVQKLLIYGEQMLQQCCDNNACDSRIQVYHSDYAS